MSRQRGGRVLAAIDTLSSILGWVAAVCVFALMVMIVTDAGGRLLANKPLSGTIEIVSNWWMPLIAFLGLAMTQALGEHISVSAFVERLPRVHQVGLAHVGNALTVLFAVAVAWYGWQEAVVGMERGSYLGAAEIPVWPPVFAVPLGAFAFALKVVADSVRLGRGGHADLSSEAS